jgi:F420-dependent oxidoreductase-like protein
MRIGTTLGYSGGFLALVDELVDFEKAGLDIVFVPEAYSFDAVSQLGFIAARTNRLQIASGLLPIYTRTPSLLAMTAAGLDYVSGGRFTLGIGTSGPQVIEGFHGVPYDAPLGRTREVATICRSVWRRDTLRHEGRYYTIPSPREAGTGLAKPLKLVNTPVRECIPLVIGAIGPKNVALAAEIADGWQSAFYSPEHAAEVWGDSQATGAARRDDTLGALDVIAHAPLAVSEDKAIIGEALDRARPLLALYIGGMGAKGRNFYNDLACRYGFEREAATIQQLYLDGRPADAAGAVPDDLVRKTSLIGSSAEVRDRLAAYARGGVTTMSVTPYASSTHERVELIDTVAGWAAGH